MKFFSLVIVAVLFALTAFARADEGTTLPPSFFDALVAEPENTEPPSAIPPASPPAPASLRAPAESLSESATETPKAFLLNRPFPAPAESAP